MARGGGKGRGKRRHLVSEADQFLTFFFEAGVSQLTNALLPFLKIHTGNFFPEYMGFYVCVQ